jgi:hypothetical protein
VHIFLKNLNIKESFANSKIINYDDNEQNQNSDGTYINNFMKSIQKKRKKKKTKKCKKNIKTDDMYFFKQEQFNNNYRDTLTAFNNIAPDQKPIFNIANLPVTTTNLPNDDPNVIKLAEDFVKQLNYNVKTQVTDRLNENSGWDEKMQNPNMKSGWEKSQTKLGLPSSIFENPAKKCSVKIINIKGAQKESTDSEIIYRINVILKKKNTDDKMAIRLNFVAPNNDEECGKRYIDDGVMNIPKSQKIMIEEIAILGFFIYEPEQSMQLNNMSNDAPVDDFFNFNDLNNNDMIDQTFIMKELKDTYKRRIEEANGFNAALDTEGRNFNNTLLDTYNL